MSTKYIILTSIILFTPLFLLFNNIIPFILKAIIIIIDIFFFEYLLNPFFIIIAHNMKKSDNKKLEEIVENTANLLKIKKKPEIFIVESNCQNAMAFGNIFYRGVMFSKGLLETLNEKEIMSITAHELSHLKNLDTEIMLFVIIISTILFVYLVEVLSIFVVPLFLLLIPFLSFLSRQKEKRADITAVKNNKWLAVHFENALLKTGYFEGFLNTKKDISDSVLLNTKQLLIEHGRRKKKLNLLSTHPSLAERLRYLSEYEDETENR